MSAKSTAKRHRSEVAARRRAEGGPMSKTALVPRTTQPKPTNPTPPTDRERALCSTCRHAERCLFLRAAHQPIWACEEFDDGSERSPGSAEH